MKTLDEVIYAYEQCASEDLMAGCGKCVYKKIRHGGCKLSRNDDALHYLKEYKDDKDELDSTRLAYLDILTDYVTLKNFKAESQANPALTWDELKTKEGKPVWIEFLNDEGKWNGEWCLVESSNDIFCEILRCKMTWWGLRKITLGKTWNAFRKERE